MKKIKQVFLIAFSGILLFFIISLFLVHFSRISFVELQTDERLKKVKSYKIREKEISSYLESYKGKFLWLVSLKKLMKTIQTFYLGTEIHVVRKFPNRLIVFLRQRDTVLLLLKDGEFFYSVSYEGKIGIKKNRGESLNFPILRGDVFWNDSQLRKKALSVISLISQKDSAFSTQNISEISYNPKNKSLVFYLIPGHFILELNSQPSPKQLKNINFVLNYLNRRGDQGGRIDARLGKKIIVKKLK